MFSAFQYDLYFIHLIVLTIYLHIIYSKIYLSDNFFIQLFIFIFFPNYSSMYLWLLKQKETASELCKTKFWKRAFAVNIQMMTTY